MANEVDDTDRELYEKFEVNREDGRSAEGEKHEDCEYFVLDLDHDPHAVAALRAYAVSCCRSHPELARDLNRKIDTDIQWKDPIQWANQVGVGMNVLAEAVENTTDEVSHLVDHFTEVVNLLNGFLWLVEKKILILSPAHSGDRRWVPVWEFVLGTYQFTGRPEPTMADESVNWGHNLEFFKAVADQLGYVFVKVEDMPDGTSAL